MMVSFIDSLRFADATMAHTRTLQKVLFKEFVSRLDESEESARVTLSDGWEYCSRKTVGAEYKLHCMAS
jgi:oligopeptidase B